MTQADLARELRDTWAAVERAMLERQEAGGFSELRPAHLPVLRAMGPDGARVSDIARILGITRQAVAQSVAALERSGAVELVPDPSDGRAKILRWTPAGRARYEDALALYDEVERRYVERVGPRRAAALRRELAELQAVAAEGRVASGR